MFYNKEYHLSDYLNYDDLNELTDKLKELICKLSLKKISNDTEIYVNNELIEVGSNFVLKGNTTQDGTPTPDSPVEIETVTGRQEVSVVGKNLFDNTMPVSYSNVNISESTIPTGKRLTWTTASTSTDAQFIAYAVIDLTNYVGKTIRFKSNYKASSSNTGRYYIGLCNADGTNRTSKSTSSTSGVSVSFVVPELVGEQKYLCLALYINLSSGTVSQNDYIDFTDMILTIDDEDMSYEPYKGQSYEINLGKNLLNLTNGTYSSNGITAVVENGKVTLNGTATANSFISVPLQSNLNLNSNVDYTFSANNEEIMGEGKSGNYACIRLRTTSSDDSSTDVLFNVVNNNKVINKTNDTTYTTFRIRTSSTLTYDNYTIYPMLEKCSQATDYAPYKTPIELCKIGDYKDFIKKGTGKNLWKSFSYTRTYNGITYTYNENGSIVASGTASDTSYSMATNQVLPNHYYVELKAGTYRASGGISNSIRVQAIKIDNEGNLSVLGTDSGSGITFTLNENAKVFIRLQIISGTIVNNTIYPQIEKGNQTTSYEPYGNSWYIEKQIGKIVLDGSENNWGDGSTSNYHRYYLKINDAISVSPRQTIFSNYYHFLSSGHFTGVGFISSGYLYLYPNQTIETTDDFKTWLSTHNTIVYYPLATPTYIEITDSELIKQLNIILNKIKYWNYLEILPINNYNLDLPVYKLNDFAFVEDIDIIERNIMKLGYDFMQPPGYIENKIWKDKEENVYKSFSYIDINRMITDMNLLYEYKDDTSTKFNINSNENWNGSSTLEWEE